jgi:hypothetical protein
MTGGETQPCGILEITFSSQVYIMLVVVIVNDSTSPAMDQSRPEPSSIVQVQSKKFLDWDRTDPRC